MRDEWVAGDRRYLSEASTANLYELAMMSTSPRLGPVNRHTGDHFKACGTLPRQQGDTAETPGGWLVHHTIVCGHIQRGRIMNIRPRVMCPGLECDDPVWPQPHGGQAGSRWV